MKAFGKWLFQTIVLLFLAVVVLVLEKLVFIKLIIVAIINQPRAWHILLGYDILGNCSLNDYLIQSISERAAKARRDGKKWGCVVCDFLDVFDKAHCAKQLVYPTLESEAGMPRTE